MEISEIHAALLRCIESLERLVSGSGYYLTTTDARIRLERMAEEIGKIANDLTVMNIDKGAVGKKKKK